MPASTIETGEPARKQTLGPAPARQDSDERRKCDQALSLWRRLCDGEAMPRWRNDLLADADELGAFRIVGSTDQKTAAVSVEEIGPQLHDQLCTHDPDWDQTASRTAILLKEIVDAAQWLASGRAPRPISYEYGDYKCPGKTIKSRFVILPFVDDQTDAMRWLALGDWCAVGG
jgi:hypothetical protein